VGVLSIYAQRVKYREYLNSIPIVNLWPPSHPHKLKWQKCWCNSETIIVTTRLKPDRILRAPTPRDDLSLLREQRAKQLSRKSVDLSIRNNFCFQLAVTRWEAEKLMPIYIKQNKFNNRLKSIVSVCFFFTGLSGLSFCTTINTQFSWFFYYVRLINCMYVCMYTLSGPFVALFKMNIHLYKLALIWTTICIHTDILSYKSRGMIIT
jgi:hypothetical protein